MRFVDCFAGIGGFHLGVKTAIPNGECVMAVEWDKHAREVYLDNHEIAEGRFESDITELDPSTVPDHDLLCGGFPCPSFSQAGKTHIKNGGKVKDDDRAMLYLPLVEILRAKQPEFCLFENVPGLARTKHGDGTFLDLIVGEIEDAGYVVTVDIVANTAVQIPQDRKRLFIVGIRKDLGRKFTFPPHLFLSKCRTSLEDIMRKDDVGGYDLRNAWGDKPCKRLPCASKYAALKCSYDRRAKPVAKVSHCQCVADIKGDTPSGVSRQGERVYSDKGFSPTLTATGRVVVDDKSNGIFRYLTPRECARLMGFPDDFRLHTNDNIACRQMGNAVCVPVVADLVEELVSPTDWVKWQRDVESVLAKTQGSLACAV